MVSLSREEAQDLSEEIAWIKEAVKSLMRRLDALCARCGLVDEESFKKSLRSFMEEELGLKFESRSLIDEEGIVYGYPCTVEVDLATDGLGLMVVEITPYAKLSDVAALIRKKELLERREGLKVNRLILVAPQADRRVAEACLKTGVELYVKL